MGQRYESKKKSVSENREASETNAENRETLKNEYAFMSELTSMIGELEDESIEAVQNVENEGHRKSTELNQKHEEIEKEKEELTEEITDELDKLSDGLKKMERLGRFEFGKGSVSDARNDYKKQIDKYKDLLGDLEESYSEIHGDMANDTVGFATEDSEYTGGVEESSFVLHRVDPNEMWKQSINNINEVIDNYREALLDRGVPDGEWLQKTLAVHRAKMMEQEGYNIDAMTGHAQDSVNNPNAYIYPENYSVFYDNLANEYKEYARNNHITVTGKNIVDTFRYDSSSEYRAGQQAADIQGFLGRPKVVSSDDFENYVRESGIVGYRTFSAGVDVATGENQQSAYFANQLRDSEGHMLNGNGGQVYGEGTYFAINHGYEKGTVPSEDDTYLAWNDSRAYGRGTDITTVTATVSSDMIIRDYDEVLKDFKKLSTEEQMRFGGKKQNGVAAFAIANGIDALVHKDWDLDYLIIYNRTKMIVMEDNQ